MSKLKFISYYKTILLVLSIFLSAGCSNFVDSSPEAPKAGAGSIDLTGWNWEQNGIVALDGEWEFYWNRLLGPEASLPPGERPAVRDMPVPWNQAKENGEKLPASGFATYRLHVRTDGGEPMLALKLPPIETAYKLWVDGRLVAQGGRVGTTAAEAVPHYAPEVVAFVPEKPAFTLTLQVSNFDHRRGGLWNSVFLGTIQGVEAFAHRKLALDVFLAGCLLIMGMYHLGIYWLRKQDRSALFFGLFCLLMSVRSVLVGEMAVYQFDPDLPWKLLIRVEYLTMICGVPLSVLFVRSLYTREISRRVLTGILWVGGAFAVCAVLAPFPFAAYLVPPYQAIVVAASAYVLYAIVLAACRKRDGAVVAFIGVAAFVFTVIYDILYYNLLSSRGNLVPAGLIVFILATSLIISIRSAKAFRQVEIISRELQELNSGLEQKVKERTLALERSNQSLEQMYEELGRLENSRRQLLSNISHDLGTPMTLIQGYVEALMDGVASDPEQKHRYLRLIHTRIIGLNRLIQDLFQLSKLEARQISFNVQEMPVREYIRLVAERYELEVKEAGLHFELHISSAEELQGTVKIDLDRMDQVYTNLIYNALKHTPAGGTIRLVYEAEHHLIVTKIHDNGAGIAQEDLPYIFDRFYKKDKSRNSAGGGSGLGLSIAREIVEFHGGKIWAESRVGQGTTVCFMLPLYRAFD
ncbi:sensor histidine kinase [Paenibacillus hamazuiensis]|uniref:sensor histidine kinase n=1 Tax=Paenibacillus hamazuiensis TaxID=2936508 RepID=UPI00200EF25D